MHRVIKPRNKWESNILETVFVDDKTSHKLCLNRIYLSSLASLAVGSYMDVSAMFFNNSVRHGFARYSHTM